MMKRAISLTVAVLLVLMVGTAHAGVSTASIASFIGDMFDGTVFEGLADAGFSEDDGSYVVLITIPDWLMTIMSGTMAGDEALSSKWAETKAGIDKLLVPIMEMSSLLEDDPHPLKVYFHSQATENNPSGVPYYIIELTPDGEVTVEFDIVSENQGGSDQVSKEGSDPADDDGILAFEDLAYSILPEQSLTVMPIAQRINGELAYSWSSDDEAIATVQDGTVCAIEAGETTIRCAATTENGKVYQASYALTVYQPVTSIEAVNALYDNVYRGQTITPEIVVLPENATIKDVLWESSDANVAMCFDDGRITAWMPGKCTLTGTAADGSGASVKIQVVVPDVYVTENDITVTEHNGYVFGYFDNSTYATGFVFGPSGYDDNLFILESVKSNNALDRLEYERIVPKKAGKTKITWTDFNGKKVETINVTIEHSAVYDEVSYPPIVLEDILENEEQYIGTRTNLTGQIAATNETMVFVSIGENNKQYFAFEDDLASRYTIGATYRVYGTIQKFVEYKTKTGLKYRCPLLVDKLIVSEQYFHLY